MQKQRALQDSLTDGTRTRWVSTGMYIGSAVPAVMLKDTRMVRLRFNAGTVYVHWQEFRFLLSTRLDVAKGNGITQHYFDFDEPVIRPKSMKKEAVTFASCGISIGFGFN